MPFATFVLRSTNREKLAIPVPIGSQPLPLTHGPVPFTPVGMYCAAVSQSMLQPLQPFSFAAAAKDSTYGATFASASSGSSTARKAFLFSDVREKEEEEEQQEEGTGWWTCS